MNPLLCEGFRQFVRLPFEPTDYRIWILRDRHEHSDRCSAVTRGGTPGRHTTVSPRLDDDAERALRKTYSSQPAPKSPSDAGFRYSRTGAKPSERITLRVSSGVI